jgi:hypothetical protein
MGGRAPPERWNPMPPSPRAVETAEEQAPWWARKRPPPGGPWKRRRAPRRRPCTPRKRLGALGRHDSACRTLEEEEAGLLRLEVSSRSSRRSGFEGLELNCLSPCLQSGADRPRPCAR